MNYGRYAIKAQKKAAESRVRKIRSKALLITLEVLIVGFLLAAALAVSIMLGAVRGIIEESPKISETDIAPKGLESTIYDSSGNVVQTLIGSGANRTLVTYDQVPQDMIDAFICGEDERFWLHKGIDMRGILRAGYEAATNSFNFTQGASTITQQLIKNNVFNGGSEKTVGARFVRKLQEQYLAIELEKTVSKETILENYLNTINLGSNCLGVAKAAERYFGKDLAELSLSECVVIAAITQNPVGNNPIRFPQKNFERASRILDIMAKNGCITEAEKQAALADNVYDRITLHDSEYTTETTVYSYFTDRLIKDVLRDLQEAGYTYDQAKNLLYSGGLNIYSTQDPDIQSIVDRELADESNYEGVTQKFSLTYSMKLTHSDGSSSVYSADNLRTYSGLTYLEFDSREEITSLTEAFKESVIQPSDEINYENIDISLQPQISVTVMDQSTGYVRAIAGGRGEKTASLSLNRATNTFRQPGSTFKVLSTFAPALNEAGDTLATAFYDEPYTTFVDGTEWSPKNWYSKNRYAGYATIRQAITYSMNIVTVRCLVEDVGTASAFEYLEDFGINTLIPETSETRITGKHDVRATLALGGVTQGVTNMQLTAAYATIANSGIYNEPVLYTKIVDPNGQIVIDNTPEQHRVLTEETSFLLTSAMADSLEETRLYDLFDSSSPEAKPDRLPAAGKSGTTTSYNDLWFVGYTPYYTMGIWSGFDDNAKFNKEDNRDFHKSIWKKIMDEITVELPYKEFTTPPDIIEARICSKSGELAGSACALDPREVIRTEYFVSGTEPSTICSVHSSVTVCAKTHLLASPYCEETTKSFYVKLPEGSEDYTNDMDYAGVPYKKCEECEKALLEQVNATDTGNDRGDTGGGGVRSIPESSSATDVTGR